jgi:hypothetical protein
MHLPTISRIYFARQSVDQGFSARCGDWRLGSVRRLAFPMAIDNWQSVAQGLGAAFGVSARCSDWRCLGVASVWRLAIYWRLGSVRRLALSQCGNWESIGVSALRGELHCLGAAIGNLSVGQGLGLSPCGDWRVSRCGVWGRLGDPGRSWRGQSPHCLVYGLQNPIICCSAVPHLHTCTYLGVVASSSWRRLHCTCTCLGVLASSLSAPLALALGSSRHLIGVVSSLAASSSPPSLTLVYGVKNSQEAIIYIIYN